MRSCYPWIRPRWACDEGIRPAGACPRGEDTVRASTGGLPTTSFEVHQRGDVRAIYGRINPEQKGLTGVNEASNYDPAINAATDAKAWTDLGVSANVARALSRPDIDVSLRQRIRDTLVALDKARKPGGRLGINGSKTFRGLVGDLATGTPDKVSQSFAELAHAKYVLEQPDLDPAALVYIGAQYKQELKGLPTIDIENVEADSYYRTRDGVVHLDEVKDTPNAFVTKILRSDQFKRYREWLGKGPKRKVGVDIRNTGPKFHRILEEKVLKSLEQTIAHDLSGQFFKVGDQVFSMKELRQLYQRAVDALGHTRRVNPELGMGTLLDRYFDTLEETLHTVRTTDGAC